MRREDGEGRTRVLHRNLLLPIGTKLPRSISPPPVIHRRRRKAAPVSIITENDSVSDSEFSNVDNSAFRNENSQVAPSVDDDNLQLRKLQQLVQGRTLPTRIEYLRTNLKRSSMMMNQMMMSKMRKMKISSMMMLTVLIMNQMIPRIKCLPGKMTIHLFQPQEHLPDKKNASMDKGVCHDEPKTTRLATKSSICEMINE